MCCQTGGGSDDGCYRYAETTGGGSYGAAGGEINTGILEDTLSEMFDFLCTRVKVALRVGDKELEMDAIRVDGIAGASSGTAGTSSNGSSSRSGSGNHGGNDRLQFDVMLSVTECIDHRAGCQLFTTGAEATSATTAATSATSATSATDFDTAAGGISPPTSLTITVQGQLSVVLARAEVDPFFKIHAVDDMVIVTRSDLDAAQTMLSAINPFACRGGRKADRPRAMEMRAGVQAKLDK